MKKPFSCDKRSTTVVCSNPKCASVRGAEGVARRPIKENVVDRSPADKPIPCYDCSVYFRTGRTRAQRKKADSRRKQLRAYEAATASAFKSITAEA